MTFEEWQEKHGPNGGAYDIEMQRAGWDGRKQQVEDLSALAARLVRALRKAAPEHNLPALAMDYLQREGLCGSPLRDAPNYFAATPLIFSTERSPPRPSMPSNRGHISDRSAGDRASG